MAIPTLSSPVGDWVTSNPATARIFEQHQIDYCCGASTALRDACRTRGLDPEVILGELESIGKEPCPDNGGPWNFRSLAELCDHIEQTHHHYLKFTLPRLSQLIRKVTSVHGTRHPELQSLAELYDALRRELEPHLQKEELILFPAIRSLETSTACPVFAFGTIRNPIAMMGHEHDVAGDYLKQIRTVLGGFEVPGDACSSYRSMVIGLQELETDLHYHILKENHILFPLALQLENRLATRC